MSCMRALTCKCPYPGGTLWSGGAYDVRISLHSTQHVGTAPGRGAEGQIAWLPPEQHLSGKQAACAPAERRALVAKRSLSALSKVNGCCPTSFPPLTELPLPAAPSIWHMTIPPDAPTSF